MFPPPWVLCLCTAFAVPYYIFDSDLIKRVPRVQELFVPPTDIVGPGFDAPVGIYLEFIHLVLLPLCWQRVLFSVSTAITNCRTDAKSWLMQEILTIGKPASGLPFHFHRERSGREIVASSTSVWKGGRVHMSGRWSNSCFPGRMHRPLSLPNACPAGSISCKAASIGNCTRPNHCPKLDTPLGRRRCMSDGGGHGWNERVYGWMRRTCKRKGCRQHTMSMSLFYALPKHGHDCVSGAMEQGRVPNIARKPTAYRVHPRGMCTRVDMPSHKYKRVISAFTHHCCAGGRSSVPARRLVPLSDKLGPAHHRHRAATICAWHQPLGSNCVAKVLCMSSCVCWWWSVPT